MLRLYVFLLFSITLVSSITQSDCYNGCSQCDEIDFTKCLNSSQKCIDGYQLKGQKDCALLPSLTTIHTEAANDTVSTLNRDKARIVCKTIKNQEIPIFGPLSTNSVTVNISVPNSLHLAIELFIVRFNWTDSDQIQVTLASEKETVSKKVINLATYPIGSIANKYLESCGQFPKDIITAKKIIMQEKGLAGGGNLTLTLQPTMTEGANWGYASLSVHSGCNNFMVSDNGLCNTCQPGYWWDSVDSKCKLCHNHCLTCVDGTKESCLSCPKLSVLMENGCKYSYNFGMILDPDNDVVKNQSSTCNYLPMLGGPKFGKPNIILKRDFTLPKHAQLRVKFAMIRVGQFQGYSLQVKVSNEEILRITQFNEPLVSALCSKQLGQTLCSQTTYRSDFKKHEDKKVTLEFVLNGTQNDQIVYGIRDILLIYYYCPNQCATCAFEADLGQKCLTCNPFLTTRSNCLDCPNGFYKEELPDSVSCKKCYVLCKNCKGGESTDCTACFENFKLENGFCVSDAAEGFTSYSKDLTKYDWVDSNFYSTPAHLPNLGSFTCGPYKLYGIKQSDTPIKISRRYNLPAHNGLILALNVFKLGNWSNPITTISVMLDNDVLASVSINSSAGSTVCQGSNKDFIYTFNKEVVGHVKNDIVLTVSSGGGIGIRDIVLILKDCKQCQHTQLSFMVEYMPVYSRDNQTKGINSWLKFNKRLRNEEEAKSYFTVSLNGNQLTVEDAVFLHDLRLFTPFNFSFINGTQIIHSLSPDKVLSLPDDSNIRRLLAPISSTLGSIKTCSKIVRYDLLEADFLEPTNNIYGFFKGITYMVLYASLPLCALGFNLVTEEFTIALQLAFFHIYIISNELPATFKLSLEGMSPIEHLNYFGISLRDKIEGAILPDNHLQKSPHTFEQYKKDITYIRGIYPIVIINIIYVVYYVLLILAFNFIKPLQQSQNLFIRWFKQLADRPINFIDGIIRWQYVTVVWTAALQFKQMNVSQNVHFLRLNNLMAISSFVLCSLYPIFIAFYLYKVRKILLKDSFSFNYEDSFFKRIKKSQDEYESFVYIVFKMFRLFVCALAIALLYNQQIAGPVVMLIVTILELLYVLTKEIYLSWVLRVGKVIENCLFICLEIIYIVMWIQSDRSTTDVYLGIGFLACAIVIAIVVVNIIKAVYFAYAKIDDFLMRQKKSDRKADRKNGNSKTMATPNTETNRSIMPSLMRKPDEVLNM